MIIITTIIITTIIATEILITIIVIKKITTTVLIMIMIIIRYLGPLGKSRLHSHTPFGAHSFSHAGSSSP